MVSKFHNETHDPKGQENKIYTIVKGRETFYRRHTVWIPSPITDHAKQNNRSDPGANCLQMYQQEMIDGIIRERLDRKKAVEKFSVHVCCI